MKVKVEVTVDTETGEYDMVFKNLSSPGESIIYTDVAPVLARVFNDNKREITSGIDSDDQVTRGIH